jgi:hypothetical protein
MQTFRDWVMNPPPDDEVIRNRFRATVRHVFEHQNVIDWMALDAPDPDSLDYRLALLLWKRLLTPEGDAIYVNRNGVLSPLPEGMAELQHLLHCRETEVIKAEALLQHEFEGVVRGLVERDTIGISSSPLGRMRMDLRRMEYRVDDGSDARIPEFGWHEVDEARVDALAGFFSLLNDAFDEDLFFERVISWPFHLDIREKAFIVNGPGGIGKTLMTKVASKLYGPKCTVGAEPTFTGQDRNRITREFMGKRLIVFNDIESPSTQLMTWLKPMVSGNMTVKSGGGYERSIPCPAVFFLETNFKPQFLGGNQDIRRFIVRTARPGWRLLDHMEHELLDVVEHEVTAADVAWHLMGVHGQIQQQGGWGAFEDRPLPVADFIEIAEEFFASYPGRVTKAVITAYGQQNKLNRMEVETLKELLLHDKARLVGSAEEEAVVEDDVLGGRVPMARGDEGAQAHRTPGPDKVPRVPVPREPGGICGIREGMQMREVAAL